MIDVGDQGVVISGGSWGEKGESCLGRFERLVQIDTCF